MKNLAAGEKIFYLWQIKYDREVKEVLLFDTLFTTESTVNKSKNTTIKWKDFLNNLYNIP